MFICLFLREMFIFNVRSAVVQMILYTITSVEYSRRAQSVHHFIFNLYFFSILFTQRCVRFLVTGIGRSCSYSICLSVVFKLLLVMTCISDNKILKPIYQFLYVHALYYCMSRKLVTRPRILNRTILSI